MLSYNKGDYLLLILNNVILNII